MGDLQAVVAHGEEKRGDVRHRPAPRAWSAQGTSGWVPLTGVKPCSSAPPRHLPHPSSGGRGRCEPGLGHSVSELSFLIAENRMFVELSWKSSFFLCRFDDGGMGIRM